MLECLKVAFTGMKDYSHIRQCIRHITVSGAISNVVFKTLLNFVFKLLHSVKINLRQRKHISVLGNSPVYY